MRIPGIQRVAIVRADDLPADLLMTALTGQTISLTDMVLTAFRTHGEATMEVNESNENKSETLTLVFHTELMPRWDYRAAFVVRFASGRTALIGTKEAIPAVNRLGHTAQPGQPNDVEVTVTYNALRALLWLNEAPDMVTGDDMQERMAAYRDAVEQLVRIPEVTVTNDTLSQELQPNHLYLFPARTNDLDITLAPELTGKASEYHLIIYAEGTPTVTFPSSLLWNGEQPAIEADNTYEFSILKNITTFINISV